MICDLKKSAKDETYEDVKKLIYKLAHRIRCCDQCEFEDRLSTAHEGYAIAYASYDPSKGTLFSTWVYWQVRGILLDRKKDCIKKSVQFKSNIRDLGTRPSTPKSRFFDHLWELSDDAQRVVGLVCEAPDEMATLWLSNSDPRGMLRSYFVGVGWTLGRITSAFSEVKEVLEIR